MRTIKFLLRKEFKQIFRNRTILVMIMAIPVIQLLILPLAANYDVKNINLSVVDHDHSSFSQKLISKITASGYFKLQEYDASFNDAFQLIQSGKADLILEIPHDFERNLVRDNLPSAQKGAQKLFVAVNAINGTKAGLGGAYLTQIIGEFNGDIRLEWQQGKGNGGIPQIEITSSNWFNPFLNYHIFMVPGILAILVTMVGGFLTALNIVKEKEVGTIEQINVTPIKKQYFILGKLIPFWILGNVVFTIGLFISWLVYDIVPLGNILVLYGFIWMFLLAILGFGLLISTFSDTQQQAMLIMFFFMMIFILMGGLFTPIDSMPGWAKVIARLNPLSYMIDVMRMVILKGSGWKDIFPQLWKIALFALVLNTWAILNYRKTA
jgi:ABC-2 type transport system permease protein